MEIGNLGSDEVGCYIGNADKVAYRMLDFMLKQKGIKRTLGLSFLQRHLGNRPLFRINTAYKQRRKELIHLVEGTEFAKMYILVFDISTGERVAMKIIECFNDFLRYELEVENLKVIEQKCLVDSYGGRVPGATLKSYEEKLNGLADLYLKGRAMKQDFIGETLRASK